MRGCYILWRMNEMSMLEIINWKVKNIRIRDILCLGHLIGKGHLSVKSTIEDCNKHFENDCDRDCSDCLYNFDCPVCVITDEL